MHDVLTGHELVLGYARSTVVHGVSVSLRPGVVTALIGPNGSGKSTVLRSLARLHPVASGTTTAPGSPHGSRVVHPPDTGGEVDDERHPHRPPGDLENGA